MTTKEIYELIQSNDLQKLRILAAEADGWERPTVTRGCLMMYPPFSQVGEYRIREDTEPPNYPTSLDAVFSAEERLGLHNRENLELRIKWGGFIHDLLGMMPDCPGNKVGTPMVSTLDEIQANATIRTAAFILTAQYKKK